METTQINPKSRHKRFLYFMEAVEVAIQRGNKDVVIFNAKTLDYTVEPMRALESHENLALPS